MKLFRRDDQLSDLANSVVINTYICFLNLMSTVVWILDCELDITASHVLVIVIDMKQNRNTLS